MMDLIQGKVEELVGLCEGSEDRHNILIEALDQLKRLLQLASGIAPEAVQVGGEVIDVLKEVVELVDAVTD